MWTVEQIRQDKPDVRVQLEDGRILECVILGYAQPFATVCAWRTAGKPRWEWTWIAIMRALNAGVPLLA